MPGRGYTTEEAEELLETAFEFNKYSDSEEKLKPPYSTEKARSILGKMKKYPEFFNKEIKKLELSIKEMK